ncbi:MAG: hypothetical protein KIH08_01800 [Candidatus Freyarchaeota archaeon]|nr:hypothetical protein [Candidatus Jordarchaeia archaeon]MBS7268746.1 hypothetical protein [Candidatus Jordarchaeia archaeon]MBS7279439.1 hypothetical protein [Candidatus Jordarchaeia archaeon]
MDKDCKVCAPKIGKKGEIENYNLDELKKLAQVEPELDSEELENLAKKEKVKWKK